MDHKNKVYKQKDNKGYTLYVYRIKHQRQIYFIDKFKKINFGNAKNDSGISQKSVYLRVFLQAPINRLWEL